MVEENSEEVGDEEEMIHKSFKPKFKTGEVVLPGERLCPLNEFVESGEGSYESGNFIYSSVMGIAEATSVQGDELYIVSVKPMNGRTRFMSPNINSIVTCTVISRSGRFCRCAITHVEDVKLVDPIKAIIKKEYVNSQNRDLTQIEASFGIGDTVIARVVGIGDGDFLLSTAEDSLGVAVAVSKAGYYMIPTSWTQMKCPVTKQVELRKVAKIVSEKVMRERCCK